jgi:hypothetical protein
MGREIPAFAETKSSSGVRVKLTLDISPELDADLDNLAEELGVTKGGAILRAIGLLKIAMEAKSEGKRVAIIDDREDSEQEITGF